MYLFCLILIFHERTWQKDNQRHRSIDLFQNHTTQFGQSKKNSMIQWIELYHDNWPIQKCSHDRILMKQQFQNFLHQNLKIIIQLQSIFWLTDGNFSGYPNWNKSKPFLLVLQKYYMILYRNQTVNQIVWSFHIQQFCCS